MNYFKISLRTPTLIFKSSEIFFTPRIPSIRSKIAKLFLSYSFSVDLSTSRLMLKMGTSWFFKKKKDFFFYYLNKKTLI